MSSGRTLATIEGTNNSSDAVFSPDGQILAIAQVDETVRLWNTTSRQEIVTLKGHKNTVHKVAFHPSGSMLASVDGDGIARLWDTATGKATATFKGPNSMEAVAFSPDGKTLAVGLNGGTTYSSHDTVRVWPVP
nr:hypothetical protein OG781_27175 [Streptomyces sp. NBC_00830]